MYTIGIDLGGTNIKAGLCDANLNIIDKESTLTLAQRSGEEIVADMAELALKLVVRNNLTLADIEYVGIATPGIANSRLGMVEYSNNLPFKNFPMAEIFKKHMPISKIYIANDANAAALGEALVGAARGSKSSIMVTLGTGVGGGIILDGKIFSGGLNDAGAELGHTVIMAGGRQCSCGRRGCWEAYSSASALTDITKAKMKELKIKGIPSLLFDCADREGKVSARTAFNAKYRGDAHGEAIVNEYINNLAVGITNLVNTFQPEIICIGGGVSGEKEKLIEPLSIIVASEQYTRANNKKTQIKVATLGNDAGIVGAAGLGR
ncbi:MAG: ROK family protein [Clostridia bacterium]|nr:ROK family protein [Clostridia bacterium]